MNVLFIIGNGFDLNLGLKTDYKDFYEYYRWAKSKSTAVYQLKKSINGEIKKWADLELALGSYTSELASADELDDVYMNIVKNLAKYLQNEEDHYDFNDVIRKKFIEFLAFPEYSLLRTDRDELLLFKEKWNNSQWNVDMITFNYTRSVEKILGEKQKEIELGRHHNSIIRFGGINHIHGYVNERMVLGVNDISQIANTSFRENIDVRELIIKNDCNKAQKHKVEVTCRDQISQAHLICIFGSSIGDTDKMWWNFIGNRLKQDCKLIIFSLGEEIDPLFPQLNNRKVREMKDMFLSKTKLTENEKLQVIDNIYVGINSSMFNGLVSSEIEKGSLVLN